jgi:hypothetical protein
MNKFYILLAVFNAFTLTLLFSAESSAQGLLTVGEVFDFSIGDKFQISGKAGGQPPNCDRITITGRFYSVNRDTLFYLRSHDSYYTSMLFEPPYIEYHFWTKTDTVFYTDLDSSISNFWVPYDSSMYTYDTIDFIAENYCDSVVNGYHYEKNAFEPDIIIKQFGKGLGGVEDYYFSASAIPNNVVWDNVLIYYQKNGISCGTPDTTAVSVAENLMEEGLTIFPNPASDRLWIRNPGNVEILKVEISDILGKTVFRQNMNAVSSGVDVMAIPEGVYVMCIKTSAAQVNSKIIIHRN